MKFETTFQTEPKQDSLKEVRCEKGIFNLEEKKWYKLIFHKKIGINSNLDKRPNSKGKATAFWIDASHFQFEEKTINTLVPRILGCPVSSSNK